MTNNQIKPCHCGYQGELHGGHFCGCLTLTCPGCAREVQAFTVAGLIDAWNKRPVSDEPVANWSCSECGATSGEACNANGCFLNEATPAPEQDGREVNSCEPN